MSDTNENAAIGKGSMSFVRSPEEMAFIKGKTNVARDYRALDVLFVEWLTKPEIIRHVLPPILDPIDEPVVSAYVGNFNQTNFSTPYAEAGIIIPALYKGEPGGYVAGILLDELEGTGNPDMGIFVGRGVGYPKKLGKVDMTREKGRVESAVSRLGINIFECSAELDGEGNSPGRLPSTGQGNKPGDIQPGCVFNLKYDLDITNNRFEFNNVKLVKNYVKTQFYSIEVGSVDIHMAPSMDDPWAELEVVEPIGGTFVIQDFAMSSYEVIDIEDSEPLEPYLTKDHDMKTWFWDDPMFDR